MRSKFAKWNLMMFRRISFRKISRNSALLNSFDFHALFIADRL